MLSRYFFFVVIVFGCLGRGLYCQTDDRPFDIPEKHISVLLVNDPESPLKISGPVQITGYDNGGLLFSYSLENTSVASIVRFEVRQQNWFGSRGYFSPAEVDKDFPFGPRIKYTIPGPEGETTPFNTLIAEKAGLTDVSNRLWILMVVKVSLSDGRMYDATRKYQELADYIMKLDLSPKMSEAQLSGQESKVRSRVLSLMSADRH